MVPYGKLLLRESTHFLYSSLSGRKSKTSILYKRRRLLGCFMLSTSSLSPSRHLLWKSHFLFQHFFCSYFTWWTQLPIPKLSCQN